MVLEKDSILNHSYGLSATLSFGTFLCDVGQTEKQTGNSCLSWHAVMLWNVEM